MSDKSKIAYGVSRESSLDSPFGTTDYRVSCGCGHKDHDIGVEIELAEELPFEIFLTFHKTISWDCKWHTSWAWQSFKKRITGAMAMLFKGHIEFEESFLLYGIEHIDGFVAALQEGKDKMMEYINSQEESS